MESNSNTTLPQTHPRAPSAARQQTSSQLFSRGNLGSSRVARPSTAVRAVGYIHNSNDNIQRFDKIFLETAKQKALSSSNVAVDLSKEISPQIKHKRLENKITKLLEQSIVIVSSTSSDGNQENKVNDGDKKSTNLKNMSIEALNKAKEAFSLDRTLHRFRDQNGENMFHNFDLTYAVFFNLAKQYEDNDMYIEALNTYSIMTKNKMFPHINQLKLNMGNIYYKMGIYSKAVKMYRMAFDSVPSNLKQLRLKITHNIGVLFVRMGQYADAAASFEFIMSERPDIRSGQHLVLCYYAMGDIEKIKNTFRNLCEAPSMEIDNDFEFEDNIMRLEQQNSQAEVDRLLKSDIEIINESAQRKYRNKPNVDDEYVSLKNDNIASKDNYIFRKLKTDELSTYIKNKRNENKRAMTVIIDLISPLIEENFNDGYNWCIEVIKASNLSWLASELELNKALIYLRQNDINQAIETLQMYERKNETSMTTSALINLTFIYIFLTQWEMAAHCINQLDTIGSLQVNPMALNNASIIDIKNGDYIAARYKLEKALQIQPENFEINYNLGLIENYENTTNVENSQFTKLKTHLMIPHSIQHSHIYYQLAKIEENHYASSVGNINQRAAPLTGALQAYLQVLGVSAAEIDSRLFEKVGSLYEQNQDHQEANQYYNEAYRINSSDVKIASSIGSYYIKLQATEKAIYYYERAILADPKDPYLMLRMASCFKHSYMPPKHYISMFEKIASKFPDNLMCLKALIQVTKATNMTELSEKYQKEYVRLHKQQSERLNQHHQYEQEPNGHQIKKQDFNRGRGTDSGFNSSRASIGSFFDDPLGPPPERPRTGMQKNSANYASDDEEISSDKLLPI